ncbi:MAG: hypothetical protein AB7P56_01670 [Nitrososphaeraceae archaeon]
MSGYKLERKLNSTLTCCCEVCGLKRGQSEEEKAMTTMSINEFCRDGSIKVHFSCSNHIVALFNQIAKEIENKSKI